MRIEASATINRPIAEVFAFQADGHYENHPRWDPRVLRLEPCSDGPVRLGSRFRMTRRMMGRDQTDTFEVVEWEAPHRFAIETRSPGLDLRIAATCTEVDRETTHLVVAGDAQLGGLRALMAPLMRPSLARHARANIERIKRLVEGEATRAAAAGA